MRTIVDPVPAPDETGGRSLSSTIVALALLSAAAGFIHAAVIDSHRGHGVTADVFTAIAVFQVAWAGLVLVRPVRAVLAVGAAANAAVLGGWTLNRTSGIPFLDGFEDAEPVGLTDAVAAGLEVLVVLGAVALLAPAPRRAWLTERFANVNLGVVGAIIALLAVPAVAEAGSFHDHGQAELAAHGGDGHAEDDGHHDEELAAAHGNAAHDDGAAHEDASRHDDGDGHDDGHGDGGGHGEGDDAELVAAGHGGADHHGSGDDHDRSRAALARIGTAETHAQAHTGTGRAHGPATGGRVQGVTRGGAPGHHTGSHPASPGGDTGGHAAPPVGHVGSHGAPPAGQEGAHAGPPAAHPGAPADHPDDHPAQHPAGHPGPQGHHGHGPGPGPAASGVTPEQRAAADQLLAATKASLPAWTDEAAHAAGFRTIGDGGTGTEHLVNWEWITDDVVLDPQRPESLVYEVSPDGTRKLAAAMFILPPGAEVPDVGGTLTQWHIHNNLCFSAQTDVDGHPARRVIGLTTGEGTCTRGERLPDAAMLHVWIVDHPCGPFSSLEGVGAGQAIDEAQDPNADPACQHSTH